jgi:hypothetical protein
MGGRLSGRGRIGSLTRPHQAGLEDGARLASVVAGMLLVGAGLLHVSAAGDHTNLPVMMAGFLVVAALQAGLGGLLVLRRAGRLVVAGGLALTFGALATWLVSRTAGLPFLAGGHMEPIGFKDGVTVLFEVMTLPPLALLASSELDQVSLRSPRLGTQAVGLLGSAMFALFVPAFVLGGGEHHSAAQMAAHGDDEPAHSDEHGQLAKAADGHVHGDDAAGGHADGDHAAHGRRATEAAFADAHPSGHVHGDAAGGGEPAADDGDGGHSGHHEAGDDNGGGDQHDGGEHGGGDQHDGSGGHGDGGSDRGGAHGDGGHGDGGHDDGGDEHGSGAHASGERENDLAIGVESGQAADDGRRARGPAVVVYDRGNERINGKGHAHDAPCEPTPEQQAAADSLVAEVRAELRQYENNPFAAMADGFDYVFGPTDRMLHVVHTRRVRDPDVLKSSEIESFIYYMTDTGWVPIGGMFVMPRYGMKGPEPGGCLTKWHHHGGFVGRLATAGTAENTPDMMHVFTYPGLDPWGHYTGRELASLWTPGAWIPSLCRSSGDANDGCLP